MKGNEGRYLWANEGYEIKKDKEGLSLWKTKHTLFVFSNAYMIEVMKVGLGSIQKMKKSFSSLKTKCTVSVCSKCLYNEGYEGQVHMVIGRMQKMKRKEQSFLIKKTMYLVCLSVVNTYLMKGREGRYMWDKAVYNK
jgi:hypothetical protein